MSVAREMLDTHPTDLGEIDRDLLVACIDACFECTQACTACADACLNERNVQDLTMCIRANQDCADVCIAAGTVLSRYGGYGADTTRGILEACRRACESCADECGQHTKMHEHCRVCADACRRCADACAALLGSLA
ncbi:four-helix bundle copper-binding protein [Okibacterium endophyticum]